MEMITPFALRPYEDSVLVTPNPPISKRRIFTGSVTKKLNYDNSGQDSQFSIPPNNNKKLFAYQDSSDHGLTPKPKFATTRLRGVSYKTKKLAFDFDDDCFDHRDLELLRPAQRLLSIIDKVYIKYTKELEKSKRTPSAMKAERDKRVKILMSMR